MEELLTTAQMRAIEQTAIENGEVTGLELMERAGRGVVEAVFEAWPELASAPRNAHVYCGPGNNGGDGFVVARLLGEKGWDVQVRHLGNSETLPPDAKANWGRWQAVGTTVAMTEPCTGAADLMVDALFGIGLARPIDDPVLWEVLGRIDDQSDLSALGLPHARTVAIDVPSGLDADTGCVVGGAPDQGCRAAHAMLTVTFHGLKQGHVHGDGPEYCGYVAVKPIGL